MQRDNSSNPDKPVQSLRVNYHKHPEFGGMGHVSIQSKRNGEEASLSVYPNPSILSTPFSVLSFFSFPTKAENKTISSDHPECSPIVASYEILSDINNHEDAHNKIKELSQDIQSGKTGFSITPNTTTRVFHALTSPNVSASSIILGMRIMDREIISREVDNAELTNCAHSVNQVLAAGGYTKTNGLFGYPTPSGVNALFENRHPNLHVTDSQKDRTSLDIPDHPSSQNRY